MGKNEEIIKKRVASNKNWKQHAFFNEGKTIE